MGWSFATSVRSENGVIHHGFRHFMEHGDDFISDGAFVVLLPYTKAKLHSKVAEYDQARLSRAVQMALTDKRNVDTKFTVFDIVSRKSSTVEKIVIQMGKRRSTVVSCRGSTIL